MASRSLVFPGLVALAAAVALTACTTEWAAPDGGIQTEYGTIWPDGTGGKCTPGADTDNDQIPDDVEGCSKDTDADQYPDFNDTDSDNDKVLDSVEAGPNKKKPQDSDGDKTPDYRDNDSDNDGVKDGEEDLNGDGKLGCCLAKCGEKRKDCPDVKPDQCGKGQKCQGGNCSPAAHFLCSNGESDPKKQMTFPETKTPDKNLPTFICHQAGETGTKGLKRLAFKTSSAGQWKVALEMTSSYGEVNIAGAAAKEAGATFDLTKKITAKQPAPTVAGFIVSMPENNPDLSAILNTVVTKLNGLAGKSSITLLSSGTQKTSHDGYKTLVSTSISIKTGPSQQPSEVRNNLFKALLGKNVSQVPSNFGPKTNDFHLRLQLLLRTDGRLLIMGAVATTQMVNDQKINTGIHVEDLSNGTGLATISNSGTVECDPFILSGNPVADIIWVVDESGSMNDNRLDVANNAKDFFSRAIKSGLDFRIAVTGVSKNSNYGYFPGKFCSRISSNKTDDGGQDRFLLPSEQAIFESCIKNPPGYEGGSEYGLVNGKEAVLKHLPRAPGNPGKIRPNAQLVIIHATDERPNSLSASGVYVSSSLCTLDAANQGKVNGFVQPDVNLYLGKTHGGQGKAIVHMIGGVCKNSCNAQVGHGYNEVVKATSGLTADVCQKNLGATMQIIINSITGASSLAKLQYVPISASIAVAVHKQQIQRSRHNGFDYVSASNTLVFIGKQINKGTMVVASYRRWVKQKAIE